VINPFEGRKTVLTLGLLATLSAPLLAQSAGAAGATGASGATSATSQVPGADYAASASKGLDARTPPTAKAGAYTLQQIISMAQAKNPTLLAAQLNLRATRAQELQAGVRANPTLAVYGSNVTLPGDGSDGNPYEYDVQVSRLFERGQKRRWRLDQARAMTGQTQSQLEDTVRQTVLTLKQAFVKMLFAKAALQLSQASLKDYRHEVEIALDRYKAGDLGKLDYERLDLQLAGFESDATNDEINLLQASDQLQNLIGIETPTPDFDVTGDIIPPVVTNTRADLLQAAIAKRPDYAAANAAVTAATANTRLTYANGTTDPTLEGEYDRSGSYNSAGFTVTIPLRIFDRNQGNKQTAQLQQDASVLTATAARNQVASDVDQAWAGYTHAKLLSDRYSEHYLDEAKDILTISQFSYEHGGLALIDYLDALRDARSSTNDALNAFANTWNAVHQLSAASATELTP